MEKAIINKSLINIGVLVILIILQHLIRIFEVTNFYITITVYGLVLISSILYFLQLFSNFGKYLNIENIKAQIYGLICGYSILYISTVAIMVINNMVLIQKMNDQEKPLLVGFGILSTIALIFLIVEYFLLGIKFSRRNNLKQIRLLGYSLFLVQISLIGVGIFYLNKSLKPFIHVFIIFELLPYWITSNIYFKIRYAENTDNE
ncbi:MAG: hypothetical protein ACOYO1_10130 [Bacteroidales bacterium]